MMRQLRVWIDDHGLGCGHHVLLEVSQGRQFAHLLHVPTLSRVKLRLDELARQERRGIASEVRMSRGLIGRIEAARRAADKHGHRYPADFVKEAIAAIRAEKQAAA